MPRKRKPKEKPKTLKKVEDEGEQEETEKEEKEVEQQRCGVIVYFTKDGDLQFEPGSTDAFEREPQLHDYLAMGAFLVTIATAETIIKRFMTTFTEQEDFAAAIAGQIHKQIAIAAEKAMEAHKDAIVKAAVKGGKIPPGTIVAG
jgi:hypothetical protein